jgi:hypothetical protein
MINLENLKLCISIIRSNRNYIDGNQLYDDIFIYMPRLNKFTFNIQTFVDKRNDKIIFSSNEDIQCSFNRKQYGSVDSYVETFTRENKYKCHKCSLPYEFKSRCHIYSLPYQFKDFDFLTNSFQGGMFNTVISIIITDCKSLEHNFFKLISESFPRLKDLYIFNKEPMNNKEESISLVVFSHLILLSVDNCHADYAELFLVHRGVSS